MVGGWLKRCRVGLGLPGCDGTQCHSLRLKYHFDFRKVLLTVIENEIHALLFLLLQRVHQYSRLNTGVDLIDLKYLYRPGIIASHIILGISCRG